MKIAMHCQKCDEAFYADFCPTCHETLVELQQYTAAYWSIRCGVPTASCFDRIMTPKTRKPSSQADDYIDELIANRLSPTAPFFSERNTGKPMTAEMGDGLKFEGAARADYAIARNMRVRQVGFVLSECERWGCSPDGLVGDDGLLELKCPKLQTHISYMRNPSYLLDAYRCQVHGQLIVTGRAWADLVSYAPEPRISPVMIRVVPDDFTAALTAALEAFWTKYREAVDKLQAMTAADGEILEPAF